MKITDKRPARCVPYTVGTIAIGNAFEHKGDTYIRTKMAVLPPGQSPRDYEVLRISDCAVRRLEDVEVTPVNIAVILT